SQCEDAIASKLFGDFSDGKGINSFASFLWEISISKPSTSTKPLPIRLQLLEISSIVLT
ncbi:12635_t:CDS:1, partial [Acaulospora colombiana]